jgi:hypothetical protein
VAALSLLVQGGTIGPLLRRLAPPVDEEAVHAQNEAERAKIVELMRESAEAVPGPDPRTVERSQQGFDASVARTLAMLAAQREALLDARDNGLFDADVLADPTPGPPGRVTRPRGTRPAPPAISALQRTRRCRPRRRASVHRPGKSCSRSRLGRGW